VQKKLDDLKAAQDEIKSLRAKLAIGRASEIAESAEYGLVVYRVDGMAANDVRDLALAIRQNSAVRIVVLGGITDTGGVSLVAALKSDVSANAGDIIKDAARAVGGGGGGRGDVATAGGKNPEALDDALVEFAIAYSKQNEEDYHTFLKAIQSGKISCASENF
jgi:alanyl-tRNA synthetase